ncbi:hypothetical protein GCM10023157_36340 [Gluconacetobacter asukensis]
MPFRMQTVWLPIGEERTPLAQPVFILRMKADPPTPMAHDSFDILVIIDEQLTLRRTEKQFNGADVFLPLQSFQLQKIILRGTDIKADITPDLA